MPWKTVTTAGTRVQLSTTRKHCARLTIQWRPDNVAGTSIYLGLPGADNTGDAVASNAYDCILTQNSPSVTIGDGSKGTTKIDISEVWLDSSANDEGVAYFIE